MKNVERNIGMEITQPLNLRKPQKRAEEKYIDDITQSISIDLKKESILFL